MKIEKSCETSEFLTCELGSVVANNLFSVKSTRLPISHGYGYDFVDVEVLQVMAIGDKTLVVEFVR